jgi:hypothetical protein
MTQLINIQIGDWSGDGHGQHEDFHFQSNKSIKDVRKAYFRAKNKYPTLCPETFCCEYEDCAVPNKITKEAKKLGFKIGKFCTCEDMAEYVAWFCKLGDIELDLKLTTQENPPTLAFYGFDENEQHIGFFGYGLLGN